MTTTIDLAAIREAAQRLANRHNDTAGAAALLNAEIKDAIAPILARYKDTLDNYAHAEAEAYAILEDMLIASPKLFESPRSLTVDGVRAGYKKEADSFDWDADADVIARIRSLYPELVPLLIRQQESLVVGALDGLEPEQRTRLGIRVITGIDCHYITVRDNDAERLAKTIVQDAQRRQGEEEKPEKTGGKVKVAA